jgi:hypothetical protein
MSGGGGPSLVIFDWGEMGMVDAVHLFLAHMSMSVCLSVYHLAKILHIHP